MVPHHTAALRGKHNTPSCKCELSVEGMGVGTGGKGGARNGNPDQNPCSSCHVCSLRGLGTQHIVGAQTWTSLEDGDW